MFNIQRLLVIVWIIRRRIRHEVIHEAQTFRIRIVAHDAWACSRTASPRRAACEISA